MEIDQRGGSEERQVEGSTVDNLENQEAGFKTASPMQSIQPKAEVKYQVPHHEMVSAEKLPKQLTKEEIEDKAIKQLIKEFASTAIHKRKNDYVTD